MNEIGKIDCSECKYFQFDEDYEGNDMSWCSKSNDLYTECCEDFTVDKPSMSFTKFTPTRVNSFHDAVLIYTGEPINVNDIFVVTKISNAGVTLTRVQMFDKF